ncbi:TPR domain protein, putative component of tonB system [alpha proteobacterium U9-1i]|nr:TPR domain protein, putative component of tonB system [alpha proteobacterium U9-1i]
MPLNISTQSGDNQDSKRATEDALDLAPGSLNEALRRWIDGGERSAAERERILRAAPGYPDQLAYAAAALVNDGAPASALDMCGLALSLQPDNAKALNVQGVALRQLDRAEEAENSYRSALAAAPDFVDAWCNLANLLAQLNRKDDARTAYDAALRVDPHFAYALNARGQLNMQTARYEDAAADFESLLGVAPDHKTALSDLLAARRHNCDWREHDRLLAQLKSDWRAGRRQITPFGSLTLLANPADQLRCAQRFVREQPTLAPIAARAGARSNDKRRVGYLSPDFRDHATSLLGVEVFERHDRSKFDVTAFSCGSRGDDDMRLRLARAFDAFVDVRGAGATDIAAAMAAHDLDIAVDMGGYTRGAVPAAFAARVAPAQVSYFVYPGTLGAPYFDYIIADDTLIPSELAQHYAEKIVRMPHSYQPNSRRPTPPRVERAAHGLPEDVAVLCCFNAAAKISPEIFASWMRILHACDAVLWLQTSAPAARNLRTEARDAGISPDRLVFAGMLEWEDHLARLALADLVLDTSPYGAHTTASDALWMGVPVITTPGDTFASRVAASLLNAVGMPELIAKDRATYEALAIALANAPKQRAVLRTKLLAQRETAPLFDIAAYTSALERGYEIMAKRASAGEPPRDINIPAR